MKAKNTDTKIITPGKTISRRRFLKTASAAFAMATVPVPHISLLHRADRDKMILSFYMDDTNPEVARPEAFRKFTEYCHLQGIRGESSVILGYAGTSMVREPDTGHRSFLRLVKESYAKGLDAHMEVMTHHELFDFYTGRKHETGIHEGLWLHEPSVSVLEYQKYFSNILDEGKKAGIRFTGLTWPGCGCDSCTSRYNELGNEVPLHLNQAVFDARLNLAKDGKFRGRVIPVFYDSSETDFGIFRKASDGSCGVYNLMPNTEDHFGSYDNATAHVDPDYYISADGKSGILVRHYENNAPYCMWYMHWQGMNPENGAGWDAYRTVTGRIKQHLKGKVAWMRPSDIAAAYHDVGGWGFTKDL